MGSDGTKFPTEDEDEDPDSDDEGDGDFFSGSWEGVCEDGTVSGIGDVSFVVAAGSSAGGGKKKKKKKK